MVKITLGIDGMMCARCEAHMNETIKKDFNVKKVTSSHADKQTVIIAKAAIDEESIKKTVSDLGYTLLSFNCEPYEKKGLFSRTK